MSVPGIHHVTALAGDPARSIAFYTGILGLRLVKRSVNQDDPSTWHLYFGDATGSPGSALTLIFWPEGSSGRVGAGQVAEVGLAVAPGAIGFWVERFVRSGVRFDPPTTRRVGPVAERVVTFRDPDGLRLALVGREDADPAKVWEGHAEIPTAMALRGLATVTIWADRREPVEQVLVGGLGFRLVGKVGTTTRYVVGDGRPGRIVDVRAIGGFTEAVAGLGTFDHVAWSVPAVPDLERFAVRLMELGLEPTPVIDRWAFHSLYVRDAAGTLHELATAGPGLMIGEPLAAPGTALSLPPWLERRRREIASTLPPIEGLDPGQVGAQLAARLFSRVGQRASTAETLPDDTPDAEETTMAELNGYTYRYDAPATDRSDGLTLVLLHGTGGNEDSLLPLAATLAPGAGVLSPRGRVLEGNAPRFFRRLAEGVLDQEDLAVRTAELAAFIAAATAAHGFDATKVVAVGFSNGANIAASLLFRNPGTLRGAILLSPMLPFEPETLPDLAGTPVFIGAGRSDPLVPVAQVERLEALYREAGADVTTHWDPTGHQITGAEVDAARAWLAGVSAG